MATVSPEVAQASCPDPPGTIYVADYKANAIDVFAPLPISSAAAPVRRIVGKPTKIDGPGDVAVNSAGDVFVSNAGHRLSSDPLANTITEYAPCAGSNAAPINTIKGSLTGLAENDDIALAPDGTLYVGNFEAPTVEVFAPGASGNVAPIRTITGPATELGTRPEGQTDGVGVDATGALYAATPYAQKVHVFKPGANGNEAPTNIFGSLTDLERPDDVKVAFDGELFVTSQGTYHSPEEGSIQVFAPHATGNVSPNRDITGPLTKLYDTDDEAVEPSGRLYVTNDCGGPPGCGSDGNVGVFGPTANGNVAPEAEIEGKDIPGSKTELEQPEGVAIALPVSKGTLMTTTAASSIPLGGSTKDTATLSGGTSPTGQIIFKLFGPNDATCSKPPAFISPLITVSGNGTYPSPSFTPPSGGTYRWVAEYSGDSNNPPLATSCSDEAEQVTVTRVQWLSNGKLIPPGTKAQTISWGTLTFSTAIGSVTCKKADAGNVWNEGGAALDETVLFELYECKSESECPGGIHVTASGLPWSSELDEIPLGSGVIRDRTTGVTLSIRCGELEFVFTGELTPALVNRPGTAEPTFEEFGPGSGELESKEVGKLTIAGDDFMRGFEEGDEVITAETEPEFPGIGRCLKATAKERTFEDPGCETPEIQNSLYEWFGGAIKNKFTSKEGTSTFETTNGSLLVTCTSDTDTGYYNGESEDRETITFKGCTADGVQCTTGSLTPGTIQTTELRSLYGFIKRPTTVGVSLEPVTGNFMEFSCAGATVIVRGSVIGAITPVSKMTKTFTETFKAAKQRQAVEKFEGGPKDVLETSVNGAPFEQMAFMSTDKVTNEELLEIREAP